MPVVGVDDVRLEIHIRHEFKHRAAEERIALRVVIVTVYPRTLEIVLVVYEVVRHAAVYVLEQSRVLTAPRDGYVYVTDERKILAVLFVHALVKRR